MKQALKATLLAAAATLALSAQATVTWNYDSKITAIETATQNADTSWHYSFDVTNTDTTALWFINFYTEGSNASNLATTSGLTNKYTQYTSGGTWGLPGKPDGYFAGFYNDSWPGNATFAPGASYSFSFDVASKLTQPVSYGYWTQNDYGGERFTAVGTTTAVPEPEALTLMLAGIAAVGLLARRR